MAHRRERERFGSRNQPWSGDSRRWRDERRGGDFAASSRRGYGSVSSREYGGYPNQPERGYGDQEYDRERRGPDSPVWWRSREEGDWRRRQFGGQQYGGRYLGEGERGLAGRERDWQSDYNRDTWGAGPEERDRYEEPWYGASRSMDEGGSPGEGRWNRGYGGYEGDDRFGPSERNRYGEGRFGEGRFRGQSSSQPSFPRDRSFEWGGVEGSHRGRGPQGYQRSDERIREEVCDRLTDHDLVDATEIEVKVESGDVILSGSVESRQAKRIAEDVSETVTGVRNVSNELRIRRDASARKEGPGGS